MSNKMFCNQCQEATDNVACTTAGACGKTSVTANLQDLLVYVTKGLSEVLKEARAENVDYDKSINKIVAQNLFITITNANFSNDAIKEAIEKTINEKNNIFSKLNNKNGLSNAAVFNCEVYDYEKESENLGIDTDRNEDVTSLKSLITFGLKGLAAYLKHANVLGFDNEEINIFLQDTLAFTLKDNLSVEELINKTMETGKYGVDVMALLDNANTTSYGNPEITEVNLGVRNNPGILISGHDLKDIEMLLEQTKGTGVDVYTHSEMLPAHYYPKFKQYDNFVGNYGGAWWQQKSDFDKFNGPILLTTNCLVPPKNSYKERIYTTGAVGFDGCAYIPTKEDGTKDFSPIIEHAKKCAAPQELETGKIVGGFAHNQVLALADKIVDAVNSGAIKKFVVMAGCDARQGSRKYYTDFAQSIPEDTVILTAGCAKYRYNKLDLGNIGGIPRVLDAGQCNDSYSLAVIALKLKEVFNLEDVNELPIVYNIAWYEQKAVIVLLALLYLGVKNIHLGPTLPAFLSPNVANVLVNNFGIAGIKTVQEDNELFFGKSEGSNKITKDMIVGEVLQNNPHCEKIFEELGMGCLGCPASRMESIEDACIVHGLELNNVLERLNQ